MARRKQPTLTAEPFPPLAWDGFFWSGTVTLPAWDGFQVRHGPSAPRRGRKAADGAVRLSVHRPDGEDESPPSAAQAAAFRHVLDRQDVIRDAILRDVFDEFPDFDLDDSEDPLPELGRPEELKDLVRLAGVIVHEVARDGVAYVGYEFGCAWEEEHGLGAMTHGDRVVTVGQADVAILEWIAEQDARKRRKKRGPGTA